MSEALYIKGLQLQPLQDGLWRIEKQGKMRVGVNLVASKEILEKLKDDRSLEQAMNVATLPGVLDPVVTMPDIHQGYGFPIGGVAAFRETGVVSPGGVGYDINCGVRLLTSSLTVENVARKQILAKLVGDLFDIIPTGVGSKRRDLSYSDEEFSRVLSEGASWAVRHGFGSQADLEHIEEGGVLKGAEREAVSDRAIERGFHQLGTLGSGNHFVEIQVVDQIYDEKVAKVFGLTPNQIVVTIHTGSRGLGYQVCADYLEETYASAKKNGLELVDRELAAAPLDSKEGKNYLKAMGAAANFAFANRQVIAHWVRQTFKTYFGEVSMPLLYDVCHNIAKWEEISLGGKPLRVCIHRKGATRALPAKHPLVPPLYREVGQPVIIPGDMGRYSFIMVGQKPSLQHSFGSACHGAGRELSRTQAKKAAKGRALQSELEAQGTFVKSAGRHTLIEEMPDAYKDVAKVVGVVERVGIAKTVARLKPIGVVKG